MDIDIMLKGNDVVIMDDFNGSYVYGTFAKNANGVWELAVKKTKEVVSLLPDLKDSFNIVKFDIRTIIEYGYEHYNIA